MTSAAPALTVNWSNAEIYQHATPYWNLATGKGSPSATTSFRHEYDINDFKYGDPEKKRRYVGERGMALGYMTNSVKLTKFMRSELGFKLLGVDCSKPGAVEGREIRLRGVQSEFVELCARYSKLYQEQVGDLYAVKTERGMVDGEFALRWGFGFAIVSEDFLALKRKWRAAEEAEKMAAAPAPAPAVAPVTPATPLAVVVGVQLPAAPAAAPAPAPEPAPRSPSVVDIDEEEDEEELEAEDDAVLQAVADHKAAEAAAAAAEAAEAAAGPLELAPYNERTKKIFVTLIKLLLRAQDTAQEVRTALRDLGNTVSESNYEDHMYHVQSLVGRARLDEYMQALNEGVEPEGWCPEMHRQIFGDDDDEDDGYDGVEEDDGQRRVTGEPTFYEDKRYPIPGIPQTVDSDAPNRKWTPELQAERDHQREWAKGFVERNCPAVEEEEEEGEKPERPKPKKQLAPPPLPRPIKREAPPPPPPPKPSPPKKKQRVATDAPVDHGKFFTDEEWHVLGMEVLLAYEAAKAAYKTNEYDTVMRILNTDTSLYRIETKRRKDGKSAGQQDTDVLFPLHSPLHKILKKPKLRSVPDIKRAFGLP
jgi:hypothetical protein